MNTKGLQKYEALKTERQELNEKLSAVVQHNATVDMSNARALLNSLVEQLTARLEGRAVIDTPVTYISDRDELREEVGYNYAATEDRGYTVALVEYRDEKYGEWDNYQLTINIPILPGDIPLLETYQITNQQALERQLEEVEIHLKQFENILKLEEELKKQKEKLGLE